MEKYLSPCWNCKKIHGQRAHVNYVKDLIISVRDNESDNDTDFYISSVEENDQSLINENVGCSKL